MLTRPLPFLRLNPLELAVLAVAAGLRIASLHAYDATLYADHPMVDAWTYWDQAQKLTALLSDNDVGLLHYWTRPSSLSGADPFADGFYQPPGYPVFLVLIGKLTGTPDLSFTRAVQALLGLWTTAMVMLLGRRAAAAWRAPWAGALAGLLYSLYPTTLLFEQDILTPALTGALLASALVLVLHPHEPGVQPRPGASLLAGLLLGLAVVVHPTYFLAAGVVGAGLVVAAWRGTLRRLLPVALFGIGLAVAIGPTTWRNVAIHDQPALVSHNGGLNFYLGNNPGWRDSMFLRPGLPFRRLVLEAEPDKRGVDERNEWWWERAEHEITEKPGVWAAVLLTKAIWSVNNREIPRNEDYRCRTDDGPLAWIGQLPVRYGLVLPWALVGAALLLRRGRGASGLPATWLALHVPVVAFIVADRYRLATWPLMCVCAGVGLAALGQMVAAWRRARQRPTAAWLLLPLGLLSFVPIDPRTAVDPAWCVHVDANLALMDGNKDAAVRLYRQALELDPDDWGARDFLARTVFSEGEVDAAAELMEPLLAWFPDHYPTLYFMARLEQRRGRLDAAADYMGRAYRVPGERTNTGVRYVRLLVEAGRRDEAAAVLQADPKLARHPKLAGILR